MAKMLMRTVAVIEGTFEELLAVAVTSSEIDMDGDSSQLCLDLCKRKTRGPDLICVVEDETFYVMRKKEGSFTTKECIGYHPYSRWMNSPLGPIIQRGSRFILVVVKETPMPATVPAIRPFDGTADAIAELTTKGPGGKRSDLYGPEDVVRKPIQP